MSVGHDEFYSVAVYDWVNEIILASSRLFITPAYAAAWKDDNEFTIVGIKYVVTFRQNGSNLIRQR